MFLIATPSKSAGSAILLFLACIAIAIFYIAVVVVNDEPSVVDQQDTSSSNSNLRRLSLIDPKTVETRVDIGNNSMNNNNILDNDELIKDMLPVAKYMWTLPYPVKEVNCHLGLGENTKPILMHDTGMVIRWVCNNGGEKEVTEVMLHVFNEYYLASKDEDGHFQQKLMLDVGSNVGYYGLLAASYGLKTIAFDLQPECIAVLQNNVLVNNLGENMRVIPKGVSEEAASISVPDEGCDGSFPFREPTSEHASKQVSVELHPLQHYLPDDKSLEIQMMKVDTEGNEKRVLASALPFFASGKIKNAIVEVTPGYGFWSKAGITPEEMSTTLQIIIDEYKYAMIPLVARGNGGFNASMLRSHIDDAQRSEILGKDRLVFTNGKKATEYMLSELSPTQFDIWLLPEQDLYKITKSAQDLYKITK
jgi:FkbM family methyltransferase